MLGHRPIARLLSAVGLCLGALLVLSSCTAPGSAELGAGTLVISIGGGMPRTLVPPVDMTIASYTINGAGPGGASFSQSTAGTAATISGLVFGQWTVTVSGKNAAGTVIGQGSGSVNIDTGKQSALAVTVAPLPGNGTINLSVTWTAANVQIPSIAAQLTSSTGSQIPLTFTMGSGSATCQNTALPSGYYTLSVQLLDNAALLLGAVEVVWIVNGQTTSGAFDFTQATPATGGLALAINPVTSDPLVVTLTGQTATLSQGSSMTISASVAGNVGNVSYAWYVNGVLTGTGSNLSPTFTIGSGLAAGVYRVDLTAVTTDGMRAGDATCTFSVQ